VELFLFFINGYEMNEAVVLRVAAIEQWKTALISSNKTPPMLSVVRCIGKQRLPQSLEDIALSNDLE
jgi:hypothetical protein